MLNEWKISIFLVRKGSHLSYLIVTVIKSSVPNIVTGKNQDLIKGFGFYELTDTDKYLTANRTWSDHWLLFRDKTQPLNNRSYLMLPDLIQRIVDSVKLSVYSRTARERLECSICPFGRSILSVRIPAGIITRGNACSLCLPQSSSTFRCNNNNEVDEKLQGLIAPAITFFY